MTGARGHPFPLPDGGLGMGTCQPQESILGIFTKTIEDKMQLVGLLREEDVHWKPLGAILVPCWKSQSE